MILILLLCLLGAIAYILFLLTFLRYARKEFVAKDLELKRLRGDAVRNNVSISRASAVIKANSCGLESLTGDEMAYLSPEEYRHFRSLAGSAVAKGAKHEMTPEERERAVSGKWWDGLKWNEMAGGHKLSRCLASGCVCSLEHSRGLASNNGQ